MAHIALNATQIFRLWAAIKQIKPDLFDDINRSLKDCNGIYVEYDSQGTYCLTTEYPTHYYRQFYISWNSIDNIHNYIMNDSVRVFPAD